MKLNESGITRQTSIIVGVLALVALVGGTILTYFLISTDSKSDSSTVASTLTTNISTSTTSKDPSTRIVLPSSQIVDIDVGNYHTCALHQDTTVSCWGLNTSGQIGVGLGTSALDTSGNQAAYFPMKVKEVDEDNNLVDLSAVQAISTHEDFSCALHLDASVSCWGTNRKRQLGHTSKCPLNSRINGSGTCAGKVESLPGVALSDISQVSVGGNHACGLKINGSVVCWGVKYLPDLIHTAIGVNAIEEINIYPEEVLGLNDITEISAGSQHTCALHSDTTVSCWGEGSYGRLGDAVEDQYHDLGGDPVSRAIENPIKVQAYGENGNLINLSGVRTISAGGSTSCALDIGEFIWCWGKDLTDERLLRGIRLIHGEGNLLVATKITLNTDYSPSQNTATIEIIGGFASIAVGYEYACATRSQDGLLLCWGEGRNTSLGSAYIFDDIISPVAIRQTDGSVLKQVSKVSMGRHICATHGPNNTVSCLGSNNFRGELGNYSPMDSALVDFQRDPSDWISTGNNFACIIEGFIFTDNNNEALTCFGQGESGQLGTSHRRDSIGQLAVRNSTGAPLLNPVLVSAGDNYACAIHGFDNEVSCWGKNDSNEIFIEPAESVFYAKSMGIFEATALSVGTNHACAVYAAGRAACWGDGIYGQLGGDDLLDTHSPLEITDRSRNLITTFVEIAAGDKHTCATHTDGTISCWGLDDGRLGHGGEITQNPTNFPQKVMSLKQSFSLSASTSHTCAIAGSDVQVYCWGAAQYFKLDDLTYPNNENVPIKLQNQAIKSLQYSALQVTSKELESCALLDSNNVACWDSKSLSSVNDLTTHRTGTREFSTLCTFTSNYQTNCFDLGTYEQYNQYAFYYYSTAAVSLNFGVEVK